MCRFFFLYLKKKKNNIYTFYIAVIGKIIVTSVTDLAKPCYHWAKSVTNFLKIVTKLSPRQKICHRLVFFRHK